VVTLSPRPSYGSRGSRLGQVTELGLGTERSEYTRIKPNPIYIRRTSLNANRRRRRLGQTKRVQPLNKYAGAVLENVLIFRPRCVRWIVQTCSSRLYQRTGPVEPAAINNGRLKLSSTVSVTPYYSLDCTGPLGRVRCEVNSLLSSCFYTGSKALHEYYTNRIMDGPPSAHGDTNCRSIRISSITTIIYVYISECQTERNR